MLNYCDLFVHPIRMPHSCITLKYLRNYILLSVRREFPKMATENEKLLKELEYYSSNNYFTNIYTIQNKLML